MTRLFVYLLPGFLFLAFQASAQSFAQKPNVVIITWHDTGRWFGCYGVKEVYTPNIDRLASEGYRFSNYFSPNSVCSPSRAAMLTGRYPQSNGCIGLAHPVQNYSIHPEETHLSELLRDQGYDTRLFGLQHETPHDRIEETLGFQKVYANNPVPPCEQVVDHFVSFLREGWPIAELFDLEKDPNEFHNLYYDPAYQKTVKELTAKLWNWMDEIDDPYVHGPMPTPWYERASEELKKNKNR